MSREGGSEPNSARGLADILREAGVSSTGAGGRRRRQDVDDNAAEADTGSDVPVAGPDVEKTNGTATGAAAGSGALGSYLRSSADAPTGARNRPAPQAPRPPRTPPPRTDTGPLPTDGWKGLRAGALDRSESTVATSTQSAGSSGATEAGATNAPAHANRSPSPLATAAPEDPDEDAAVPLPSGALSWAILIVELLAALGLGVAAWYAFSALWDLLPYVAAFAGPLVVTGLVAVAGALRARTGRNPLGLPTLCILVFAGTVLVVLPAATLIVP
ncbi:MAG: hypothetical protein H0T99_01940 [Geodermatophilaceae bacterium]|nr:hypothetical protein [Geodermatophilaceae bacterium]